MKLPTRKKQVKAPTSLPKDFVNSVGKLFLEQFKSQVKGASFVVQGGLYADEILLCVSLAHPKTLRAASLHMSMDMAKNAAENPEKVTERLKSMVDVAASWFAQGLEAGNGLDSVLDEMQDLDTNWQEIDWEGTAVFVLLNKNNYTLEKAADEFLKKAGIDPDEDEVDEAELEKALNEAMDDMGDDEGSKGPLH